MQPTLRDVGSTFPHTEVDRPLTTDLSPRGAGIEARLRENAPLPSTKVWQMEQQTRRLQQQSLQQREHLRLLQTALRKQCESDQIPGNSITRSSSGIDSEAVSPRTAEVKLYEEQCVYLGAQLDEEHEFCDAYRQQLNKALLKNMALKRRHENAVAALKDHEIIQ